MVKAHEHKQREGGAHARTRTHTHTHTHMKEAGMLSLMLMQRDWYREKLPPSLVSSLLECRSLILDREGIRGRVGWSPETRGHMMPAA